MKWLLPFKRIDFWAQVLAVIVPAILALIHGTPGLMTLALLVVLKVQIVSYIVNGLIVNKRYLSDERKSIGRWFLYIIIPCAIAVFFFMIIFWMTLFVVVPVLFFLAFYVELWYFVITIREITNIKRLIKREEFR
ncbi:hypothetical protein [Taibaiella soli]|uniref:Uncharacterized protein n=1 Tax=Taibaiella soli TaxID=1649169 RepID=A0A2W2AF98_9BACT|nr:hypothetical protein [Taibaiella soli]PZF74155.1 hypothetical protein DN068_03835 [Taibaiella soli]